MPSRFLEEIPKECLVERGRRFNSASWQRGGYTGVGSGAGQTYGGGSYGAKPKTHHRNGTFFADPVSAPAPMLELQKGDMVDHTAFGRGMVLSVMKMGGDALLEIAFDEIGTKKLLAKAASSHMKKL